MYKLSRHWAAIRYTYISVKDTSDVYQWIEAYITGSKNEEVKKQTTRLDLRLGSESGKGDDTPFWYNDDSDDNSSNDPSEPSRNDDEDVTKRKARKSVTQG